MNVLDELKKLLSEATTDEVKQLLSDAIAKVEAEARKAAADLQAHIEEHAVAVRDHVTAESQTFIDEALGKFRDLIALIKKAL